jgi:hypothetical protein
MMFWRKKKPLYVLMYNQFVCLVTEWPSGIRTVTYNHGGAWDKDKTVELDAADEGIRWKWLDGPERHRPLEIG